MGQWATVLARNGVAALVFDQRGAGASTGDGAAETGEDRVEDVRAALDWARTRPEVDGRRVGVLSYSAGGWVAPLAIAGRDHIVFWVSLAGPAEGLGPQQGHVTTALMPAAAAGGPDYTDAEYDAAYRYQTALVDLARSGASWPAFEAANETARAARWAEHALIPDSLDHPDLDYYRRRAAFDGVDGALRRVHAPTFAVYGGADVIVPPSENVPRLRARFREAGNEALTVLVLDGVDHGLGRPGGPSGDGAWPEAYVRQWARPGALFTTVVEWTLARVAGAP